MNQAVEEQAATDFTLVYKNFRYQNPWHLMLDADTGTTHWYCMTPRRIRGVFSQIIDDWFHLNFQGVYFLKRITVQLAWETAPQLNTGTGRFYIEPRPEVLHERDVFIGIAERLGMKIDPNNPRLYVEV